MEHQRRVPLRVVSKNHSTHPGFWQRRIRSGAFPLSAIPLQSIVGKVEAGDYITRPSRVFAFEEIARAHQIMESGQADGKLVVKGA